MTTPHRALAETYSELLGIVQDRVTPHEAHARVRALHHRHPDIDIDLVWDTQPYDGTPEYDAILSIPGTGSVSLSLCPETSMPWSLRGVQRHREADLVHVNNVILQVGEAVQLLDMLWHERDLMRHLIDACLLREALGDEEFEIPDEALQDEMDEFRRARGLLTAEQTVTWLNDHGLSQAALESQLAERVAIKQLRDRITAPCVEEYFQTQRAQLARVRLVRAVAATPTACQSVIDLAISEAESLANGAVAAFSQNAQEGEFTVELVAKRRLELPKPVNAALESLEIGNLAGPIAVGDEFWAVQLLSVEPAVLDDPTQTVCKGAIFRKWLDDRRAAARIEWQWGTEEQTKLYI